MSLTNYFALQTLLLPYMKYNDTVRLSMAHNHIRQALPLLNAELPIIRTGYEQVIAKNSRSFFRQNVNSFVRVSANVYEINNQLSFMSPFVIYDEKQKIVYDKYFIKPVKTIKNSIAYEYIYGINLHIAYMNYFGFVYQDGCVISESAAKKLTAKIVNIYTIEIPKDATLNLISDINNNIISYIPKIGYSYNILVDYNNKGVRYKKFIPTSKILDIIVIAHDTYKATNPDIQNLIIELNRRPKSLERYIGLTKIEPTISNPLILHFIVEQDLPCKVGDKIANRHGNKAVVNLVVPDEEMPFDKTLNRRVDLIYSPLSIPSRMNIGQLMEQLTTKILYLTKGRHNEVYKDLLSNLPTLKTIVPDSIKTMDTIVLRPFTELDTYQLLDIANKYNVSELSDVILDGRTLNINTGIQYIMRLEHTAISKATGSSISNYDGQRVGEMETWNIIAHDGDNVLKELFNYRSHDISKKVKFYSDLLGLDNYHDDIPETDMENAFLESLLV